MRSSCFFSIIIPTLNEEGCLPHLLRDIKKQTFPDYEVLVIDAQSKDNTVQVAQRFKKVKVIKSAKANVSAQRNLGGKNAKGKYLLFIDADTRIPVYFLEGLKYKISIRKPDLFSCWMNEKDEKRANRAIIALFNFIYEAGKFLEIPVGMGIMIGCLKKMFEEVGGFNPEIAFAEDTEFVRRAFARGYRIEIFKDPRVTPSLRRFRKEGTLPMLRKYAKLNLGIIINGFPKFPNKEYPMIGGGYYKGKKAYPRLLLKFDKILQKIKQFKSKEKVRQFMENFFLD